MKYINTVALIACIILSNVCYTQDKNALDDSKKESKNKAPKANATPVKPAEGPVSKPAE